MMFHELQMETQGVSYSQKLRSKRGLPNLANGRTFQFVSKYLKDYQNLKLGKSKFKSEKSRRNKHKSNAVLKRNKKRHENRHDFCYVTFK